MRRRRSTTGLAAVTAALGLSLACATSGIDRLPSLGVAEAVADAQVARLRVDGYFFEPNRLMVQVDVPVRLIIESTTLRAGHDFSIFAPDAGLQVNTYVPGRQQVTVQFLPRQTGEYQFYCNIDDHADRGMVGTLVVVESLGAGNP